MKFERCPLVELSDGKIVRMYPFHISMEGMESRILCRNDEDYDVFIKTLVLSTHKKLSSVVVYCVVSNHAHYILLTHSYFTALEIANEVKRIYSMYLTNKYSEKKVLKGIDVNVILIDSDRYLRNAIAYDIRNALDNGANNVNEYEWSSFRSIFCNGKIQVPARYVNSLSKREKRYIMRSHQKMDDVMWQINPSNALEPASICDWKYVEGAFLNDHSFFMRSIGTVNSAEMKQKLIDNFKERKSDQEMIKCVDDISCIWYNNHLNSLPIEKKARLLPYIYRTYRTTPNQLARIFEISREKVFSLLNKK